MSAQSACTLMNPGIKADLKSNLCNVEAFRSLQRVPLTLGFSLVHFFNTLDAFLMQLMNGFRGRGVKGPCVIKFFSVGCENSS